MMSTANTCVFIAKDDEKKMENLVLDAEVSKNLVLDEVSDLSLEPHLVTDKDEASLKVNKEQLLGSINVTVSEESKAKEVEVKVLNLIVQSPGRADYIVATPFRPSTSKATLFTLKEGCKQQIKFEFVVSNNTISSLKYIGEVWKKGIKVDVTKKVVGKFSARDEPYKFELPEATTPSGFFARGAFAARTRFVDEEGKCHFDATYYFDIQKNWAES